MKTLIMTVALAGGLFGIGMVERVAVDIENGVDQSVIEGYVTEITENIANDVNKAFWDLALNGEVKGFEDLGIEFNASNEASGINAKYGSQLSYNY